MSNVDHKNIFNKMKIDKEIEDDSVLSTYLSLVTENLRVNYRKITRNSFWLILSLLLYIMILDNNPVVEKISILFVEINDSILLLNLIPVFFSFIYFQNIALWNNNENLIFIFNRISTKLLKLGIGSDTKTVIRPFSFILHVTKYQFDNKKISRLWRIPITVVFIIISLFPIVFEFYSIYHIAIKNFPTFFPIACGIVTGIICFTTIIQLLYSGKS